MPSDPKRVQAVFLAAAEQSEPAARAAVLERECGADMELRRRVEALLNANDDPASFLDRPAVDAGPEGTGAYTPDPAHGGSAPAEPLSEAPGLWIGPYRLLQKIGEGGMGTVWMAEQEHPVRRRVALKVIKPGMDSSQVIARFEAERQALAMMDHQNIAKVLDAGTAPQGRPYFVMELIKGVPITKFCDEHHLTPKERLELFVPVCQAVQHAHQKGVIHRDLKPSNVLVTLYDGRPVPKVIDFGVAKALHQKLTERTLFTDFGAVVGTLEYMAPEQAALSHLDVDTRSDVYSLGVLLYELLTGTTPFERKRLRSAALDEMLRIIREEEPPKPSTRLSESGDSLPSIAAARKTEPAKLSRLVRGELDWIVMRALEKDRGRRYETANGFARDIQRYLADEAVEACPPSAGYRLRKFVRRHRGQVAGAAVILFALVVGVVGATWGLIEARQERDAAEEARRATADERDRATAAEQRAKDEAGRAEAARALADRNFQKARAAVEGYLEKVTDDPNLKNNPNSHELRKQLLAAALPFYEEFVKEKSDDPAVRSDQGEAYRRLGAVRAELGDHQAALRDYTAARDIRARLAADFPAVPAYRWDLASSHQNVGLELRGLGRRAEAEAEYRAALAVFERLVADFPAVPDYGANLASSRNNLGNLLRDFGKQPEAEAAYRAALALRERLAADFPAVPAYRSDLATSHNNLGLLLRSLGKRPEAEAAYRAALAFREKLAADFPAVPEYRWDLGSSQDSLGNLLADLGKRPEAEAAYRAALALQEKLAADFPAVPAYAVELGGTYCNLGNLLQNGDAPQAALDWYAKAIACLQPVVAAEPRLANARQFLRNSHWGRAKVLAKHGRPAEAVPDWDRAIELADGTNRTSVLLGRARALALAGETVKALSTVDELAAVPNLSAVQLYNLACVYAVVAAKLPPADAERPAARAVEWLRQAVIKGYRDIAHLLHDTDLDALRRRDDYAGLLWDLADLPAGGRPTP